MDGAWTARSAKCRNSGTEPITIDSVISQSIVAIESLNQLTFDYNRSSAHHYRPPFSKIFFSETAWPIKAKFYMKHLWEGGTNVFINNPGHMTKMAAMPIYCKYPSKIFSSGTGGSISTKFGMKHRGLEYYNVFINYDLWMTLAYFTARST